MNILNKTSLLAFFGPLCYANYRSWLFGRLISIIGEITLTVTMPSVVFLLTNSLTAWSTVVLLQSITRTLLVLFGGALVDRYKADNILILISWAQVVLASIFLVLSYFSSIPLWFIWIWAIFNGFILALLYPSINSIIPFLLPRKDLMAGNGLYMTFNQIVQLIVPLLIGIIVSQFGTSSAFIIAAVAPALFAIILMNYVKVKNKEENKQAKEKNPIFTNIMQGFNVVKNDKSILTILISLFIFMFGAGLMMHVGLPGLAQLELEGGTKGYGYFISVLALGAATGSFLSGGFQKLKRKGVFAGLLLIGFSAFILLTSLQTTLLMAGITIFFAGICWSAAAIIYTTMVQIKTPEKNMGSVMALVSFALVGAEPIAFTIATLIGDSIGSRGIMVLASVSVMMGGLVALLSKTFWGEIKTDTDEATSEVAVNK